MKSFYTKRLRDPLGLAIVDLTDMGGNVYDINRINVPVAHRRKGIGNEILNAALRDADQENITLVLAINAYGDMSAEDLQAWYERKGFTKMDKNYFVRKPGR